MRPRARAFLRSELGPASPRPAGPVSAVVLPEPAMSPAAAKALSDAVGPAHVDGSREARLAHCGGSSLSDLLARRHGRRLAAPDAVLRPGSHDEVLAVLRACAEHDVAVVPFGGGTSVVGGVAPDPGDHHAVVAVAFDRLAELVAVDEVSMLAAVQPGITGPVLERLLGARGLTWGHLPQSWERASIGGYLATRSAGQASTGYGRSDETVESLVVATPSGALRLGRGPSSAAGPDLRQLFLGGEGVLGIITEAVLRVRRLPAWEHYEGMMLPSFGDGLAAFRELAQAGLTATVMRLSDEAETVTSLTMSGPGGRTGEAFGRYLRARGVAQGCLVVLGWEAGSARAGKARRDAAHAVLRRHGAVALGSRVGRSWRAHRFGGPYLRDELLDAGYLVETLETATHWSALPQLHDDLTGAVRDALATQQHPAYVMAHVSHVYETGASLYVTALAAAGEDPASLWAAAKRAAGDTIAASGATITHHHAVGADHAPWLQPEIGDLGVQVLAAVKGAVDPQGILNPGKLLPQVASSGPAARP
jgi:alkyldihydroxyacetonephosphate synthase